MICHHLAIFINRRCCICFETDLVQSATHVLISIAPVVKNEKNIEIMADKK